MTTGQQSEMASQDKVQLWVYGDRDTIGPLPLGEDNPDAHYRPAATDLFKVPAFKLLMWSIKSMSATKDTISHCDFILYLQNIYLFCRSVFRTLEHHTKSVLVMSQMRKRWN